MKAVLLYSDSREPVASMLLHESFFVNNGILPISVVELLQESLYNHGSPKTQAPIHTTDRHSDPNPHPDCNQYQPTGYRDAIYARPAAHGNPGNSLPWPKNGHTATYSHLGNTVSRPPTHDHTTPHKYSKDAISLNILALSIYF